MCSDDNALLEDARKRISGKEIKDLLPDGLRAGHKHVSTADSVLHYHLQEECSESTPDAVSVGQAITNFSPGYAKAALDNGPYTDHTSPHNTPQTALMADIASPLETSSQGKGR
jgi:hypothetical protein